MVRRVFVEKKPGFDVEAVNLLADLKETLGIKGIEELRLFNRYDAEGLSEGEFERAKTTIFSEPNVDNIYNENLQMSDEWTCFSVEYLPGQYDQRADSAAQCIQLLTQKERPAVANARVYAFKGQLSEDNLRQIKKYVVNPVESRIASETKPQTLDIVINAPDDIETVDGFTGMSDSQIAEYHSTMGFAMTVEDLNFCRDYFKSENRDPFVTELKVIDTYWSDHCRHTTFSTELTDIKIEKSELNEAVETALGAYFEARSEVYGSRDKKVTLMDMATMGTRLLKKKGMIPDLDESEEINACSIEAPIVIDGKEEMWLIQFKNETHNHPTEIEPFGGAATCLGGAIRDPLSGRSYVYQAMRVTGAADPTVPFEDTMENKLPQKKITKSAAAGYSSYGNQIGLATGQVTELYHDG
ncbi:MAG: phosphoribosylformylglycinamidine synthase, partial [Oscillospiraceae bacterium]|nr:phosphoribosylformylglycinamidine synthase [Oscillospiraceae bacterium]